MHPLSQRHQINVFFNWYYISFQDMQYFFEFLVSVINHYHINGLHLFWDSFQWFCLQISSDAKYFFLSCPRHCNQGLIVIVYYFQIWNKKEPNIIISKVISSHMGHLYIETPYTLENKTIFNLIVIAGVSLFTLSTDHYNFSRKITVKCCHVLLLIYLLEINYPISS